MLASMLIDGFLADESEITPFVVVVVFLNLYEIQCKLTAF